MVDKADKTILYVEDNAHNRRIVRKILENRGFTIIEADDGIRGLNSIRENRPPLVLLDISLPGMDGIEVARRVKADDELKHIFLIALTASAMHGDRERFLAAGCDDYMSKPFKAQELIEMVEANYAYTITINAGGAAIRPRPNGPQYMGPPNLPAEKLVKLQEARRKKSRDNDSGPLDESKVRLRAIRGTTSLPTLPDKKQKELEKAKKESGSLDKQAARYIDTGALQEPPIQERAIVPRLDSGSLELPKDKAEELEVIKRETGMLPPLEEGQKQVSSKRTQDGAKTDSLPEVDEVGKPDLKMDESLKKSHSKKMSKEIEAQISSTVMDLINIEQIDPATPNAEEQD